MRGNLETVRRAIRLLDAYEEIWRQRAERIDDLLAEDTHKGVMNMPVLSSHKDPDALTLTFVAEFDASVERVWQVWEDPRQLERWWGPPTWPATFEKHDFTVGGQSHYYMTGPDGEKARGWWTITAIDAPRRFEYDDGFSDDDGTPDSSRPTMHGVMTLDDVGGKTRMTTVTEFVSTEQLEQVLAMGMEEGMVGAMGQIDDGARRPGAAGGERMSEDVTVTASDTVRSADGTTIAYEKVGTGPALVLVDGALCSRDFGPCRSLANHLADRFTVYFYDRRGRGGSGDTPPYSPAREYEDLDAVIRAAGGTAYVTGFSSGAALALQAAASGVVDAAAGQL